MNRSSTNEESLWQCNSFTSPISLIERVTENIIDPVSFEFMTEAVTLFPCGHVLNEDTTIRCIAQNKLCPLDRRPIEKHTPNFTVRDLAIIYRYTHKDPVGN